MRVMGGPFLVRHSYEGPNWDYPHKKFLKMVKSLVNMKIGKLKKKSTPLILLYGRESVGQFDLQPPCIIGLNKQNSCFRPQPKTQS